MRNAIGRDLAARMTVAAGALALLLAVPSGGNGAEAGTGVATPVAAGPLLADTRGGERRDDRRDDRDDRRDNREECRDEGGALGKDKRDCKQEGRKDGPEPETKPEA